MMTVQKVCPKKLVVPWRRGIFQKVLLLVSLDSGNKKIWNRVFTLAIPDFVLFTMYRY